MEKTIKFKDLSGWLKLAAIAGWITAGWTALVFIVAFIVEIALL